MQRYANLGGDSSVESFEIGPDFILVKFVGRSTIYRYSYSRPGMVYVDRMKSLATTGRGLGSYIQTHPAVRKGYEHRF